MVKVHKLVAAIATTFTLSTTGAYALNMGEISWKSAYGQPLNATIELSDTAGLTAKDIRASLASHAEFANAGIIYSNDLAKLTFTTIIGKEGKAYINVTSNSPIKEPYIDLLVNVSYQGNKLSKDYTILLDLPSTKGKTSPASQAVNKGTKQQSKTEAAIPVTSAEPTDNYQVQKGDTLWSVAEKVHGTKNTAKTASAIYKKNPKAFINGSIDHLIAGYNIKLPTEQEVRAISVAEATNLFQKTKTPLVASQQVKNDKVTNLDKKQAVQLETKLKTSEQQLNNARLENDELSTKLEQLQAEIDKLKEVSDIKDEQIKTIKSQIVEEAPSSNSTPTATSEPTNTQTAASTPEQTTPEATSASEPTTPPVTSTSEQATTPETASTPEPITTPPATSTSEPTSKPEATSTAESPSATETASTSEPTPTPNAPPVLPVAPPTEDDDNSLFFGLDSSMLMKIGGGILLLVCVAAFIIRRKKAAADDSTEVDLSHVTLDDTDEQHMLEHSADDSTDTMTSVTSHESSLASLDDGTNILDKADIYLAYNRYNEARDLLVEALKAEPTNEEYRLKLLEVYAEQGDNTNFETVAQDLLLQSPLAQHKIDSIRATHPALLSSIDGFHSMEDHSTATLNDLEDSAKSTPVNQELHVVDEFPTISNKIPEHHEEAAASDEKKPVDDLQDNEINTFSFDTSPDIEDAVSKANADFSLETIHTEPTIEETPLFDTNESSLDGFDTDSPIYEFADEEPKQDEPQEENFKFDLGISESPAQNEKHPEHEITESWSGFSDSLDQPSTASTVEEHSTDHFDEIIEKDQVTTKLELVHAYIEMNDIEGAQDLLHEIAQEGNEAQKAEAKKLLATLNDNAAGDDIAAEPVEHTSITTPIEEPLIIEPLSTAKPVVHEDVSEIAKLPNDDSTADFNINTSTMDITSAAAELDLGFELSPEDEVSTKLELARAYIDMGDSSGARDILDEVLKEGNAEQKNEAEQLIATLS